MLLNYVGEYLNPISDTYGYSCPFCYARCCSTVMNDDLKFVAHFHCGLVLIAECNTKAIGENNLYVRQYENGQFAISRPCPIQGDTTRGLSLLTNKLLKETEHLLPQ
jgi:hypothetical protein